jgi:hypothetical protein
VEAADDELLLARVGVDVAHREHAALARFVFLGVDRHLLALQFQAPVGDGAEPGRDAEAGDQRVERQSTVVSGVVTCSCLPSKALAGRP